MSISLEQPNRLSRRQQQVVDAAKELARSGEAITSPAIAAKIGDITANHVNLIIGRLRKTGDWTHPRRSRFNGSVSPGLNLETQVMRDINGALSRLPDERAKRRVLEYVEGTIRSN